MRTTRITLIALVILAAAVALAACRRDEPRAERAATAAGQCPSVEGSYFGSDKSSVTKGEAARLSLKLPREYVNAQLRVEQAGGGETSTVPFDLAALQEAVNPPALEGAKFPVWIERGIADVRPERTTKYVLKAEGPKGCQPLSLPAPVYVIEPEDGGRAEQREGCPGAKEFQTWVAPQAEDKSRVRLMWDAPGAQLVEVDGRGTEVTRGSMMVLLDGREPSPGGEQGRPAFAFKFESRREGCAALVNQVKYVEDAR
jgi:hypothetical protein